MRLFKAIFRERERKGGGYKEGEREREGEKEKETEREREKQRETERDTHRETQREQRDNKTKKERKKSDVCFDIQKRVYVDYVVKNDSNNNNIKDNDVINKNGG